MYGKEYEEWREQRATVESALGKLTKDEIDALAKRWTAPAEEQGDKELLAELRRMSQQDQQASQSPYLGYADQTLGGGIRRYNPFVL